VVESAIVMRSGTPAGGVASSRIAIDIRVTASATGDIVMRGRRIAGDDAGAGVGDSDGDIVMRSGRFVERGGIRVASSGGSVAIEIVEIK
jgi:hypothetical protein